MCFTAQNSRAPKFGTVRSSIAYCSVPLIHAQLSEVGHGFFSVGYVGCSGTSGAMLDVAVEVVRAAGPGRSGEASVSALVSGLGGLWNRGRAFGADQFRPDAVPRLAAKVPPPQLSIRHILKPSGFGGIHVAPTAQTLIEVRIAGAGVGGDPLAGFCGDFGAHAVHHSDSLRHLQAIRYMKSSSELLENATMETASQRRRRKLIALCDLHGLTEVATRAELNPAALDQIVKGIKLPIKKDGSRSERGLGDVAARAIEGAFGLGGGWFDSYEDAGALRAAGATTAAGSATLTLCATTTVPPDALVQGDPSDGTEYNAMLTDFARRMASLSRSARVGIAAMLMDIDDPAKAAEVALEVSRLAGQLPETSGSAGVAASGRAVEQPPLATAPLSPASEKRVGAAPTIVGLTHAVFKSRKAVREKANGIKATEKGKA